MAIAIEAGSCEEKIAKLRGLICLVEQALPATVVRNLRSRSDKNAPTTSPARQADWAVEV
jgi:hypothetical protein